MTTQKNEAVEAEAVEAEATEVANINTSIQPTGGIGRGFEGVDMADITMPRAKLLQSNSPEVSDRDYNLRAGDVIHSLLMEKLPSRFIPLQIFNSNILFVPREDGAKIEMKQQLNLTDEDMASIVLCRAADGIEGNRYGNCAMCGKHKFHGNDKPICTPTINVLAVPLSDDNEIGMPVVIQFATTSYKHGKKFRDGAFYSSMGCDLFDRVYKLDSFESAANGNRWYELKTKPAGLTPAELKPQILCLYNSFAGKNIVVEAEEATQASNSNLGVDIDF